MATEKILRDLDTLLGAERQNLRTGAFSALAQISDQKARLLDALAPGASAADGPQLDALKRRAEANQRLLTAALRGVQAARSRVAAILNAGARLDTYDSCGRPQSIAYPANGVERRA